MSDADHNEREPFPRAELYFYIIGTVVVPPLAKSGWDALMAGDYFRGLLAITAALVAAVGAFSFRYWESHLEEPTRKAIREIAKNKAIVGALALIFIAYVGVFIPDLIQKLEKASTTVQPVTTANTPKPASAPLPLPQPTATPTERVFTDRAPGELLALFEGRTMVQGNRAIEPYKGMWIKVEGKLNQIMPNGPPGATTVIFISNGRIIYCNTGPQWHERLIRMSPGDELSFIGKLNQFQNGSQLQLEECELN
jgi:hypothetical protein